MSCKHREKDNCKKDGRPCIHDSDCFEPIPITNADRIRAMSDEELAEFLCGVYDDGEYEYDKFICGVIIPYYNEDSIKEWLKQPADEERDN